MRIGIDARELCGRATGVGRYLAGLLAAWAADAGARHEFVLYAPDALTAAPQALDHRRFSTRLVTGAGGTRWEQLQLPRVAANDHLDVFFAPGYTAPLFPATPLVVAIHDISFVAHPEWFTTREGLRRRWLTRQTAARARAVVTISEFSRGEIVNRLGVPADRVHVIPPGVTVPAAPAGQHEQPSVLFVGTILNRRRVPELIRAFAPIARTHPSATLDIVGDNRSHPRQDLSALITHEGLERSVRWRSYVSDQELGALYGSARAFAFLSEYEGLGLTPIEALAVGVPPVLLDTPVAHESCGEAALYVWPEHHAAITSALNELLFDEHVRRRLLQEAPRVLSRYDWHRAAAATLAVLERAAQ